MVTDLFPLRVRFAHRSRKNVDEKGSPSLRSVE